ncbi:Na+/H+ antiporter subunit E [Streptomyces sp. NK08204]|uniref:Na+/H+ antiporter subunit E n=1 Tax=Streptomyces sp. NK08204 TaxID=2873260 RepID=UPI001CECA63D|nr:Na+/H+ antiporter subunit E [Streptomyces sp. NK08204]
MVRAAELVWWWWAAAVGVWLLTLSSVTLPDLMVAAACGLPSAVAARAGRLAVGGCWRPRAGWIRWAVVLPPSVVADTGRVLWTAVRHARSERPPGKLREIALPHDTPEAVAAARRALATVGLSATPGTYVLAGDPERHCLVVHSLSDTTSLVEKAVTR